MRSILMCLVFLCTLSAAAQDVIVKKDGNTVVCRVMELSDTEVIFKRWTELQGNNYVMNLTDVAAIHYENGGKKMFDAVSKKNNKFLFNEESQIDDGALLAMDINSRITKRTKRLRQFGWICGSIMLGTGITLTALGLGAEDPLGKDPTYIDSSLLVPGALFSVGGIALTTGCLIWANNLKKKSMDRVISNAVWQNDFLLNNKTTLSTQICTIRDTHKQVPALGLGISYQF